MKFTYKYILPTVFFSFSASLMAQNLNSGYFIEGLNSRHDLNPAFGSDENYVAMPGLGNININMMGNFGLQDVLFDNPTESGNNKSKTSFMNPYINASDALSGFKNNNKLDGEFRIGIMSAGFKGFGGYNTIELNLRAGLNANLPYELFEFAKNTGNKSYDIGDINAEFQSYAELAFGHSRQINDKLRLGAKVKLLFGIAHGSFEFNDMKANLTGDEWTISGDAQTNISLKGATYKMESKDYKSKTGSYQHVTGLDTNGGGLNGFGLGLDLGAEYKINKDFTVSAALLDLGFITWNNNILATNSNKSFMFSGFHDVAIKSSEGSTLENQSDSYSDQIADFANLQDKGDQGSKTTELAATMNFGCQYVLPCYRQLKFGLLSSTKIYGKYSWTEGRLNANVAPLKWVDGGVNFGVNTYRTSFGWIVNFHPKAVNFFVGMDHTLGKCSKEMIPLSSNASVSMGLSFAW